MKYMNLVILFGPPAVGKMTVGQELAKTTGLKLFHNHVTIDLVLKFLRVRHERILASQYAVQERDIRCGGASELAGLIFTFVWALDHPGDKSYVDKIAAKFSDRGGMVYYVELQADLQTRLKRNKELTRLEQKPSKRDVVRSETMLLRHDKEFALNTSEQRPFFYKSNYLKIVNTPLAAVEVAAIIKKRFGL